MTSVDAAGPRAALAASLARLDAAIASAIDQFERALQPDVRNDPRRGDYITHDDTERLLSAAPCEVQWSIPAEHMGGPKFAVPLEGSRLTDVQRIFGLTAAEVDALLIAASVDLDPRYERLYGYLQDDVRRRRPTVGTVARLAGTAVEPEWEALAWFAAHAPLVPCKLVHLVAVDLGGCPIAGLTSTWDPANASYSHGRSVDHRLLMLPIDNGGAMSFPCASIVSAHNSRGGFLTWIVRSSNR